MTARRNRALIAAGVLLFAAAAAGAWWWQRSRRIAEKAAARAKTEVEPDRTYKVKRDDLVIGLIQSGYVNASSKHKLALLANYRTKLLWVIEENTKVKEGDLLARFETADLIELIENQEIELDNLSKELEIAYETEKILISTNAAELQDAEEKLLQTDDALRKYRRFERASTRDNLDLAISDAEDALDAARNNYTTIRDTQVQASTEEDADAKKRKQLKDAQSKIEKSENSLETAENNRRVFRRYDNPSKLSRLINANEQAKLNLRKIRISTASKVVQQKKSIGNLRRRIKRCRDQLARYREYLAQMEIKAPVDGIVIYNDPDRRWNKLDIKPGLEVGKGQVLFTIPEMANLIVEFDLPEQYRSKVSVGNRVIVSPDSLPGVRFGGEISHIDTLPVYLITWDTSSPKIYKTKVKLDHQSPKLVNGMSTQINIVAKTLRKVLAVPVEAVFEEGERYFVYRMGAAGPKEVNVTLGESNDNMVEIRKGLAAGDTVCLYRPFQKTRKE